MTNTNTEPTILARITFADAARFTHGMSPDEKFQWLDSHTSYPEAQPVAGTYGRYRVASLTELAKGGTLDDPASWHTVDVVAGTCTCPATRTCFHMWFGRKRQLFGQSHSELRMAERYERETGQPWSTMPVEMPFDDYRETRAGSCSA